MVNYLLVLEIDLQLNILVCFRLWKIALKPKMPANLSFNWPKFSEVNVTGLWGNDHLTAVNTFYLLQLSFVVSLYRNRVYFKKTNMKEVPVREDEYRVWWCSLFAVFMRGSLCVMTPLILTSDVLLTQALSWESVRLVLNKLWPRFLLLLSLLFLSSLVSLYHVTVLLVLIYMYFWSLSLF